MKENENHLQPSLSNLHSDNLEKNDETKTNNSFLITFLSILLLVAVLIAGFFAYRTQTLVKEVQTMRNNKSIDTPAPSEAPEVTFKDVVFDNLKNGDTITSPFRLSGSISKSWTFESAFTIEVLDSGRKSLKLEPATAIFDGESEFGTFSETLKFSTNDESGFIVVHADNPSGLPENDKAYEVPVLFYSKDQATMCTLDAKICPDGSAVGRSGPKCEFAPCPSARPSTTQQP